MKQKTEEWSEAKKWNPFNSYKLLAQVYRWKLIQRGEAIPQPALVTIDPTNNCNLKCIWCNSEYILKRRKSWLSKKTLLETADFLANWQGTKKWEKGVEAVCIAGGGEPLLHHHVGDLIDRLVDNGIEVGVVTNGTHIDKFIKSLSKCTWVGVSVDAGTPETFKKIKGKNHFEKVVDNMGKLIDYSTSNNTMLGSKRPGYGVSYKYLLHPYNAGEIVKAVKIAEHIKCKNFHLRPMGIPWDKLGADKSPFDYESLRTFKKQIEEARKAETKEFGVYGVTHKFDSKLDVSNTFKECYAIFMTCAIMPATDGNNDHVTVGLCCDRRGDKRLEIMTNEDNINKLSPLWGSKKHWKIFDDLDMSYCPRCTYQPHNQIYEHVIKDDSMTYKFI